MIFPSFHLILYIVEASKQASMDRQIDISLHNYRGRTLLVR